MAPAEPTGPPTSTASTASLDADAVTIRRATAADADAGLDLYCFVVNANARRFYERQGFTAVAFGDGSRDSEHQPDIRYAWRPDS